MKPEPEIEYIPLDKRQQESSNKRGFLKRLFDCLSRERVFYYGSKPTSSSGEEVEEDVIKF